MVSSKLGLGGGGSGGGGGGNKEEEREMKRTGNIFRARKTGNASPGTEKEKKRTWKSQKSPQCQR